MSTPQTLLEIFKRLPIEMQAQSHMWVTDVQEANALELIELMSTYAQALEDACTPRAPKPEWFEKWPHWWVNGIGNLYDVRVARLPAPTFYWMTGLDLRDSERSFGLRSLVLPISGNNRIGYPAPVGWKAVGE